MTGKHLKLDSIKETIVDPADNSITILPIQNLDKPTISNEVSMQKEILLMQYAKENKFLLSLKSFLISDATKELTLDDFENLLDEFTNYFNFDNNEFAEHSRSGYCVYPPQSKFSSNILFLHDYSSSRVKGKDNAAFIEILKNAYNNQNFTQDFESRIWKCHLILNSTQNEIHTFQFLYELDYLHFVYAVQYMTSLLKETKNKRSLKQIQCPYKQGVCQYIVNSGATNGSHKNAGDQEPNKPGGLFHRFLHNHAAISSSDAKNHFTNSDTFEFQDNVLIISYQMNGNNSSALNQMGHLEIQLEEILAIALHTDYTIPMPYLLTAHLNSSNDASISTAGNKPGSMNNQMVVKVFPPPGYTAVPTNFGSSSNMPIGIHTNSITGEMEYCHEHIFSSFALPFLQHQQLSSSTVHTTSDRNQPYFVTAVPLSALEWSGLLEDTKSSTLENNRMSSSNISSQQWKVDIISLQSTNSNNYNIINTNSRNICTASQSSNANHSNSTNFVHVTSKTLNKSVFLQDIQISSVGFDDMNSSYARSSSKDNSLTSNTSSSSRKGNSWASPKRSSSAEYPDVNLQSSKLLRSMSPPPSSMVRSIDQSDAAQFSRKGLIFGRTIPVELIVTSMQQQQQQSLKKALRLVIQRASDITLPNIGKSYTPSVYCTAYLVGKGNERLTMNQAEVRTEAIKSFTPSWDHEILLQDASASSIDDVCAVMILLRDSSSGILKHKHIGQITIPIECFLPDIEANLSLPLEPSYRMDAKIAEKSFIGNIHVVTQLVDVESTAENPTDSKNKTVALKKRLSMRSPSMELGNASMRCTLYKTNPLTTWWPIKVLSSTSGSVNSNTLAHNDKQSDKMFAGSGSLYSRVYDGFLLAGPQKLLIKLDPNLVAGFRSAASTTAVPNPPVVNHTTRRPSKSGVNTGNIDNAMIFQDSLELSNGVLHVPWQQVENAYAISPGGLLLTLTIHFHTSINNASGDSMKYIPASIEVIVGPCPAYHLHEKLMFRKKHDEMIRVLIELYKEQSTTSGAAKEISPSSGKSALKLNNNLLVTPNKGLSNSPPLYTSPSSIQSSGSKKVRMLSVVEIVTCTHKIVNNLLNSYHEIQQLLCKDVSTNTHLVTSVGDWRSNESATLALPLVHLEHAKWESVWVQLIYQYFQKMVLKRFFCSSVYYPYLVQAEEIPHYSNQNNFLIDMIENDIYDSSIMIPMLDGLQHHSSAGDLVVGTNNGGMAAAGTSGPILQLNFLKRFEGYLESLTDTILDYIIFSQKVSAINQKALVGNGDEENSVGWYLPHQAKACLEVLILGYYQGLVKALSIYVGKRGDFVDKSVTNDMRYIIVQFLFLYQFYFPVMMRRILYMTNVVHFTSKYPLTLCQHLPKVMKWYVVVMLEDLKEELVKLITEPQKSQQSENDDVANSNAFPWVQTFAAQCLYYIEKYFILYPDSTFSEFHASNGKNNSNISYNNKSSKENLLDILAVRTQAYRSQFSSQNRRHEDIDKTNYASRKSFNHEEKISKKESPRSRQWIFTLFYNNKYDSKSNDVVKDPSDNNCKIDGLDEILPTIGSLNEQFFLGMLSLWKTIVFEEMLKFMSVSVGNKLQQMYSLSNGVASTHNPNVTLEANNLAEDLIRQVCTVDQILFESVSAFASSASAYLPHHLQPKLIFSKQCDYANLSKEVFQQYFLLFDVLIQQMATLIFVSASLQNVIIQYDSLWCTENSSSGSNSWELNVSSRQNSSIGNNQSLRHIMQNLNKSVHDYEAFLQLQQSSSDSSNYQEMVDDDRVDDMASEEYRMKMMGSHDERYRGYLISLIYTCSEIIVMRYLLLFRDKVVLSTVLNSSNGGANHTGNSGENNGAQPVVSIEEKQRFLMDIEYLKEQFAILLQSAGYDEFKVKQRAREQQKRVQETARKGGIDGENLKDDDAKAIWWLPKLDYFSSRWVQFSQTSDYSYTNGTDPSLESYFMPLPMLLTPIEWLYVFYALVFEDHHSVAFNTSLNTFLQYHRFCDYTSGPSAMHDCNFVDDFIFHVIVPLRNGYQDAAKLAEVVNYLQEIISSYHNHNSMYDYSNSSFSDSGTVKKDVLYRMFGEDLAVNAVIYNVGNKSTFFSKFVHPSTTNIGNHSKVGHGNLVNIASSAMKSIRTTLNVLSVGNNNTTTFPSILLKSNRHSEEYGSYILSTIGFEFGFSMCSKLAISYNICQQTAHIGGTSIPPTPQGGGSLSTTPISSVSSSPFYNLGIKEILLAGTATPNLPGRITSQPGWLWDAASDDENDDSIAVTAHNEANESSYETPLKRKDSFRSSMKSMFSMSDRKNSFNATNTLFSPTTVPAAINISNNNNIVAGRTMSNSSGGGFTSGIVNLVRTSSNQKVVTSTLIDGVHISIDNIAIKGLQSSSFLGKANPYIAFSSGSQRVKTSTRFNVNEANWKDEPPLMLTFPSREILYQSTLLVEVFDKERIRRKHILGLLELPLSNHIIDSGNEQNTYNWYVLKTPSTGEIALHGGAGTVAGEVAFSLSLKIDS